MTQVTVTLELKDVLLLLHILQTNPHNIYETFYYKLLGEKR